MASKLRFSLAACLLPVVLSAAGAVQAADTPATDTAQATQPSCTNSSNVGPNDEEGADDFGAAVAVDGQTIMVGIPGFSTAFITPPVPPPYIDGRVAIFTCQASTQTWIRTGTLQLPTTQANLSSGFGSAVALQGDVAAISAEEGLFLYKRQGQNWNQVATLFPEASSGELWGSVLAFKDDVLAVGVIKPSRTSTVPWTYSVDLYKVETHREHAIATRIARLKPSEGDTGAFGQALALDADGDTLVVGDSPDTTVYVYKRHGVTFELDQKLTGAEATPNTGFGSAVAIAKDVILIGAGGEDTVINPGFGIASSGGVYAFRHASGPDSPWVETQHFNPAATDYSDFGGSLAVNDNGQAVIGTPSPYDFEEQTSYGPTFFYILQGGQFVLSSESSQYPGSAPATDLGITDEYLIIGTVANAGAGGSISGAGVVNLTTEPE
jgi:FG-GAP repeat